MALYLDLTVRFFDERHHGNGWPPSPARLFQALVAGSKTGAPAREWNADRERALKWLESLEPPAIFSRTKSDGQRYTIYVPNNSLAKGQSTKTSKRVAPIVLANHSPGDPDVIYRWRVADPDAARLHLPTLDQLAGCLRALGWGIDFAAAAASLGNDLPVADGLEAFAPGARGGTSLQVPVPGLLEHLGECHRRFARRITAKGVDPNTRPTRFGQARYRRADSWIPRRCVAFEMQDPNGRPFAARWDQAQTVAAWVRHAAGTALLQEELAESWVNSFVFGHTPENEVGYRLSFVPLPSIGHQNSDGGIRRVLIVEPPGTTGADAEALDLLRIKLSGWTLTDENGKTPRGVLVAPSDRSRVLPFFVGRAEIWQTVTPVVLHGHNASRGRISLSKTDRLLVQAFEAAGYPEPIIREITFQSAPYWPGCGAASAIRVPRHLVQWPRLHVRVEFTEAVEGPVLAGIGRHCGVGIFAGLQRG
jgi:CRISPR-associated protein Csb2